MIDPLATALASSPPADLLRLVAVPVFGWAAYRDIRTRRVPNRTWLPLALLGVALLGWEVWRATSAGIVDGIVVDIARQELFFLRVALSLGMVGSIGYLFYWIGGFGGADAKALIVLAVLFPTFPQYLFPGFSLPLTQTTVGVFSLTVLTNTVFVGALYPIAVTLRNALSGHVSGVMFLGKPVQSADVVEAYGSLMQTPEGTTRRGLDLDALRMYLQWRGCSLAELRSDPDRYRDPDSLPADPNPPGDGSIPVEGATGGSDSTETDIPDEDAATDGAGAAPPLSVDGDDPWGAAAFLDDIEGSAYGTTPETLREGLEVLVDEETVWVSPGMPFIVPMFVGLLVSLVYGDLFVAVVGAVV